MSPDEVDDQSVSPVLYAAKDAWIWDYTEVAPTPPAGPSTVILTEVPDSTSPSMSTTPSGGSSPSASTPLAAPEFSIGSGVYPITSFELPLTLTNPNPTGSSTVFYSINFGDWKSYATPLSVPPGAVVGAQAIATSDLYSNSGPARETFDIIPADLLPPIISPDHPELGLFSNRLLSVTLTDQNSSSISRHRFPLPVGIRRNHGERDQPL